MKRKEFITLLGVGAGSVVIASCLGACGKSGDSPSSGSNPSPGTLLLTINSISANPDINLKGWTIQNGGGVGIIIAKSGANYLALASTCTHAGFDVTFNGSSFPCTNQTQGHGSVFNADGSVKTGPAVVALKKYNPVFDQATDTLKVYA